MIYWFKYRTKPSNKLLVYVGSNKKKVEDHRKFKKSLGLKVSQLYIDSGNSALISTKWRK